MNKYLLTSLLFTILSFGISAQELNYYWAQQYGHDNFSNDIKAVSSDHLDNIICFTDFNTSFAIDNEQFDAEDGDDLLVFSIDEDGATQWAFSDGGIGNQTAQKVACDMEGNIYLMGKFSDNLSFSGATFQSNGNFDMYLIKLNSIGEMQWVKTFGGPNSESFESLNIHGNKINIVGRYYNYTILENDTIWGVDGTDFFASQFDLDGNLIQYVTFGGESVDYVSDVTADNLGNIYITGDFYQNLQIGEDILEAGDMLGVYLIKLNSNLQVEWWYQPEGSDLKPGVRLAADSDGNIAMTGNFSGTVSFENNTLQTADFDEDIYMAYFNSEGNHLWSKRFYSSSAETISALAMDGLGHIYLSGQYLNHIHFNDIVIQYNLCCGDAEIFFVKLDEIGEVLDYSQITGERSNLKDMYVPKANQVILVGQFSEHMQIEDLELNSPTSYNAFLAYYKDDTWLFNKEQETDSPVIVNTLSNDYFQLRNLSGNNEIRIFNISGQLLEQYNTRKKQMILGRNWDKGFYLIQIESPSEDPIGLKVLKL